MVLVSVLVRKWPPPPGMAFPPTLGAPPQPIHVGMGCRSAHLRILQHSPVGGQQKRGNTHTQSDRQITKQEQKEATRQGALLPMPRVAGSHEPARHSWTSPARRRHGKQACYEARQASSPAPRPHPNGRQVCHRDADSARKGRRQGEESAALGGLKLSHSQHNQHTRLLTHSEHTPHLTCIVPV